jgi:DNA polymerase IV
VPRCIESGKLLDPSGIRFIVKGAPQQSQPSQTAEALQKSTNTESPFHGKLAETEAIPSPQEIDPVLNHENSQPHQLTADSFHSSVEERVEDSFVIPSPDAGGELSALGTYKERTPCPSLFHRVGH